MALRQYGDWCYDTDTEAVQLEQELRSFPAIGDYPIAGYAGFYGAYDYYTYYLVLDGTWLANNSNGFYYYYLPLYPCEAHGYVGVRAVAGYHESPFFELDYDTAADLVVWAMLPFVSVFCWKQARRLGQKR